MPIHRLVPSFILDQVRLGIDSGSQMGAVLFADVSGFTALADSLMAHGRRGAEVLAEVIGSAFASMMRAVNEQGGFIFSQEGDAFTAVFFGSGRGLGLRALAAAVRIQEEMARQEQHSTPFGTFTIQVRVGLSYGEVAWAVVSSADGGRAAYYFKGLPVDASAEAQSLALPKGTVLDGSFLALVAEDVWAEPAASFYRLADVLLALPDPLPAVLAPLDFAPAQRFYPHALLESASAGEFREVVNLFISLPTIRTALQLAIFLQSLFALQDRYGGVLSRLGFGDKGPHLFLFWGAPSAHENDVERALHFILDLQTQTAIPINCGVTYRIAYTGFIGSEYAEDYAPFGRGTSLAARLMARAPRGEIWVDEFVAQRAGVRFELEPGGELSFKGFAAPQAVFILGERKEPDESAPRRAWVGRQTDLAAMDSIARQVWNGRSPGALILWGEPGIGKSSTAREWIQRQQQLQPELVSFSAQCDEILRQPLNPFRYWLRRYFQIPESLGESRSKRVFNRKIDQLIAQIADPRLADELDRTRSFLGSLVDLRWPDSLYEQLDARSRYENTFLALAALLQAESLLQPFIFLLEDAHWLDEESRALLPQLLRALAGVAYGCPVLFLITARTNAEGFDLAGQTPGEVRLERMERADLQGLAQIVLGGPASGALLTLLEERTEGNPFFIEQILAYLKGEGLLVRSGPGWTVLPQRETALPADVGSLLLARLDRLPVEVKEVVQTAAVLGREFEERLLAAMRPDDPGLHERIAFAAHARVWTALDDRRLTFQHALLRDAAYQMQAHQRLVGLHRAAFEALQAIYGADVVEQYGPLAFHAGQAGMMAQALHYDELAGRAAIDAYQNRLAEEHFTRALANPLAGPGQRLELLLCREQALDRQGLLARRHQDLAALEELAGELRLPEQSAEVLLRKASCSLHTGAYVAVEQAARQVFEMGLPLQQVAACNLLAIADLRRGRYETCIAWSEDGLALAEAAGVRERMCHLLNTMGMAALERRELDRAAEVFERSLQAAEAVGRPYDSGPALNNLGLIAGLQGRYREARAYYERSLEITRKTGDRSNEALVLGNLGWVAGAVGAYGLAVEYTEQYLRTAREVGNATGETYSLINLGAFAAARLDFSAAERYAAEGADLAAKIGDRSGEGWARTYRGHAALGLEDYPAASAFYQQALAIRQELKQPVLAAEPLAGLARAALNAGKLAEALGWVEEVLPLLTPAGLDGTDEPVRVYLACFLVLRAAGDPRANEVLQSGLAYLEARADQIRDLESRQMFLENIVAHREILAAGAACV